MSTISLPLVDAEQISDTLAKAIKHVIDASLERIDYGEVETTGPVLEMLHQLRMAEQAIDAAIDAEAHGTESEAAQ